LDKREPTVGYCTRRSRLLYKKQIAGTKDRTSPPCGSRPVRVQEVLALASRAYLVQLGSKSEVLFSCTQRTERTESVTQIRRLASEKKRDQD
jgi:hypothetical protein